MVHIYRCFGCPVIEGYGMTETSCVISTMDEDDNLTGHVGSPNPACGKSLKEIFMYMIYPIIMHIHLKYNAKDFVHPW